MGQKVQVLLLCDVEDCGSEGAETVWISYGQDDRALELCADHRAELDECVGWAMAIGRPHRKVAGTRPRSRQRPAEPDNAAIRAWARANGWPDLGDRGRIPGEVRDAYAAKAA